MLRHALIAFSIVLVAASGTLAKKEPAIPSTAAKQKHLALLEPAEKTFLDGITPLEIAANTVIGDRLAAWQLEPTGALLATEGLVTTVQMMPYPIEVGQFLTYRISIPMQYRENSYTVPLVKNNKLAGLLLRYDSRSDRKSVV